MSSFALMVESPHRRAKRREPSVRNARLIAAGLGRWPSEPPWMCALYERSVAHPVPLHALDFAIMREAGAPLASPWHESVRGIMGLAIP
nr:hypothetical protein [Pseudoxanthomonas sp.]